MASLCRSAFPPHPQVLAPYLPWGSQNCCLRSVVFWECVTYKKGGVWLLPHIHGYCREEVSVSYSAQALPLFLLAMFLEHEVQEHSLAPGFR